MTRNRTQPTAPDRNPEPDDDFLDDDLASDPARMTLGMKVVYFLLFFVVAIMVGYLILIILYPERFAQPAWIGATPASKEQAAGRRTPTGFGMAGIVLSMTPADIRAIYPDTRFEAVHGGGLTGLFRHHDGDYQVWFRGSDKGERSYRIQSRHAYAKISYAELLAELGNKFGSPEVSSCGAEAGTIAIRCALRWQMPDVALDASIRTAAPPAGAAGGTAATTTVTITATDLRPDSMFSTPPAKKPVKPAS